MVFVKVDGLLHTYICPCQWTNKTRQICCHGLAAIYCTVRAWEKEYQLMISHMVFFAISCHNTSEGICAYSSATYY